MEIDVSLDAIIAVTFDAVPVKNGLDVAGKIEYFRHIGNRLDLTWAAAQGADRGDTGILRRARAVFVTSDATGSLAGHYHCEALHSLDGDIVFIECDEEQTSKCRQFHIRRAVRFNRDRAENAGKRKCAAQAYRFHCARMIDGFGESFEDEQSCYIAAFDAVHVATLVYVCENKCSGRVCHVDTRGYDNLFLLFSDGSGFVDP